MFSCFCKCCSVQSCSFGHADQAHLQMTCSCCETVMPCIWSTTFFIVNSHLVSYSVHDMLLHCTLLSISSLSSYLQQQTKLTVILTKEDEYNQKHYPFCTGAASASMLPLRWRWATSPTWAEAPSQRGLIQAGCRTPALPRLLRGRKRASARGASR